MASDSSGGSGLGGGSANISVVRRAFSPETRRVTASNLRGPGMISSSGSVLAGTDDARSPGILLPDRRPGPNVTSW